MMHKPHANQTSVKLNTSSSYFHLLSDPSPTVLTLQGQRKVLIEDTQCSSRIRSLKTAKASKIVCSIEAPLSHFTNITSCLSV